MCSKLYRAECWALRVEDKRKLKTTEMRMLRMICEKNPKDKINNEQIREMTGVERLEEFLRLQRLLWLGHVERMDEERGLVNHYTWRLMGQEKEDGKNCWNVT